MFLGTIVPLSFALSLAEAHLVIAGAGVLAALIFFVPLWGPHLVFWGIVRRRTAGPAHPSPIYITSDGIILLTYLCAVNAAVDATNNQVGVLRTATLAGSVNLLVVLIWWRALKFLQLQQIADRKSRLLLQSILYPGSVIVPSEALCSGLALLSSIEFFESGIIEGIQRYAHEPLAIAAATIFMSSACGIWALRALFRILVRTEQTLEVRNASPNPSDMR